MRTGEPPLLFWPKASFHRSLGRRPRTIDAATSFGCKPYSPQGLVARVMMACSQTPSRRSPPWGGTSFAPGYGDGRPAASLRLTPGRIRRAAFIAWCSECLPAVPLAWSCCPRETKMTRSQGTGPRGAPGG